MSEEDIDRLARVAWAEHFFGNSKKGTYASVDEARADAMRAYDNHLLWFIPEQWQRIVKAVLAERDRLG